MPYHPLPRLNKPNHDLDLPIPPPASIRKDSRPRAKTIFYKPHDIRAVSAALREIMDRKNPPSPIFATDNDGQPSDTDIMRSMP